MKDSTVQVQGQSVQVTTEKVPHPTLHVYKFTATLNDSTYSHTLTVGAVDGPIHLPTPEELQAAVDEARKHAATRAHFHNHVAQLEAQIT